MTLAQHCEAKKIIRRLCSNYCEGNCIRLDKGEEVPCPQMLYETTGQTWADALNKVLSEMCGKRNELKKDGASCYPPELLASYFERYDVLVTEGLEANPIKEVPKGKRGRKAKGKTRCLLERLRDYKDDILRFASDWSVPFTNNEAECCVRFSKVMEKDSGCFRTKTGADNFMHIMSYIGSAKKHGMIAFAALLEAVNGRSLQTVQA